MSYPPASSQYFENTSFYRVCKLGCMLHQARGAGGRKYYACYSLHRRTCTILIFWAPCLRDKNISSPVPCVSAGDTPPYLDREKREKGGPWPRWVCTSAQLASLWVLCEPLHCSATEGDGLMVLQVFTRITRRTSLARCPSPMYVVTHTRRHVMVDGIGFACQVASLFHTAFSLDL